MNGRRPMRCRPPTARSAAIRFPARNDCTALIPGIRGPAAPSGRRATGRGTMITFTVPAAEPDGIWTGRLSRRSRAPSSNPSIRSSQITSPEDGFSCSSPPKRPGSDSSVRAMPLYYPLNADSLSAT